MIPVQLIVSDQFNKIEVQLEIVIKPCALLAANGGFEMGMSKLNKLLWAELLHFCIVNT